jgi:hypothetical protein
VPSYPRRKVDSFGFLLRSDQLPKSTFICLLIGSEIGTQIRQCFDERLSIVELGERKVHTPHISIAIAKLNISQKLVRGLIFRNCDQLEIGAQSMILHNLNLPIKMRVPLWLLRWEYFTALENIAGETRCSALTLGETSLWNYLLRSST